MTKPKEPQIWKKLQSISAKINSNNYSTDTLTVLLFIELGYHVKGQFSPELGKWEAPNKSALKKLAEKLHMPLNTFLDSLEILGYQEPSFTPSANSKEINLHSTGIVINSMKTKDLQEFWKINTGQILSMADKMDLAQMETAIPDMKKAMERWFQYQLTFKGYTMVEKRKYYLFGDRFHNFQNNIHRFYDAEQFRQTIELHKARIAQTETPSYGFSVIPAEDRKLAIEDEREKISLAIQMGEDYNFPIVFPENISWYEKKLKKENKK